MNKKTLVIGGSENPERYSNKAIKKLRKFGHEVVSIGLKKGKVEDVLIQSEKLSFSDIHTVTMYVGPKHQPEYYDYILSLKPKRVLFNPGTENLEFESLLKKNNIAYEEACTLVLLSIDQF
jgi:predicted CoA-binding protein